VLGALALCTLFNFNGHVVEVCLFVLLVLVEDEVELAVSIHNSVITQKCGGSCYVTLTLLPITKQQQHHTQHGKGS
jgi:hypothetical protein